MERKPRVGRGEFDVDPARQQEAIDRYDEGRGLIGGDPNRRPGHVRWRPIPEEQPYFRLIDVSEEKRAQVDAFLHEEGNSEEPGRSECLLEIEIGFGTGEFLLGRAAANVERRFLGFEVKRDLCRGLIPQIQKRELTNLWICDDDARWALPQLDLAGRVDVIHILYPDPWWKKRHQVKRLFNLPFVELLHELLAPGGLLHVRSDVEGYAEFIEQAVKEHGGFSANNSALAAFFDENPPTRREAYCREIGRPFRIMSFARGIDPSESSTSLFPA